MIFLHNVTEGDSQQIVTHQNNDTVIWIDGLLQTVLLHKRQSTSLDLSKRLILIPSPQPLTYLFSQGGGSLLPRQPSGKILSTIYYAIYSEF